MIKRYFVGLLTHTFRGGDPIDPSQPSQRNSSDRFSPKERDLGTYSGGTVRDSHPVILFSIPGFDAGYATKWVYVIVTMILTPGMTAVKRKRPPKADRFYQQQKKPPRQQNSWAK